jgi:3-oxoacyl-[acyl-carrier protein] reductase
VSDEVLSLAGKVAMVTGGARGIGRSIALLLAQRGADVAVVDLDSEGAAAVAAEIEALGRRATGLRANVSVEADVRDSVAAVEAVLGPIDILVNNAGLTRDGFMARMSEADWDLVLDVNLKGAFLLSKAVSRGMMKQRSGSIVNMASVVGRRGNAGQVNYSAAKAGLIGLTKSLARELASRNVRVNAIAPGYIQTEMTAGLSEAVKETIVGGTPLGRMGTPDDVAQAVAFLASDAAAFITGTVLPVDGGLGI